MSRLLSSIVVLGAVTPAVVALPVATPHVAVPHPVAAHVAHLALAPVAAPVTAAQGPALRRTALGVGQTTTSAFTTVGVTWKHDTAVGAVAAEVRWRHNGTWSAWRSLAGDSDDAPDAGSPDAGASLRDGTAPLWVGRADGVQARVSSTGHAPSDVRVELVDPGTSAADATAGSTPRDSASAMETQPPILTRADWGADESMRVGTPAYNATIKVGFVHHTDTANDYTEADTPAVIRSIYAYHVKSNGWNDIGYNFLVDRFGRIWEGRYGGITRAVLGAHTGGFNTDSFGTSLIGTFTTTAPPAAALASLEQLFAWRLGAYYRDPTATATLKSAGGAAKYAAGTFHTFAVVSGHRDAGNTSCPGDATYARMSAIRTAVSGYLGTAFVDPSVSATRVPVGSTTPLTIKAAGSLNAPAWTIDVSTVVGTTVRSWTGTADAPITASWDYTDAAGLPVPIGSYVVTLRGTSADGDTALPFSASVTIGQPLVPKGAWIKPRRYSTRFS
jgi:hypothetical protein